MRIYAYIDGFNFYHGLTKDTQYRWCNLVELCKLLLPKGELLKVKLFAAHAKQFPDDPEKPIRQGRYISALKTIPEFEFVPSMFTRESKYLPLSYSPPKSPTFTSVVVNKEKGADVNLGSHLLSDGINNLYDLAMIVTNDSDLAHPLAVARYDLNKFIYLLLPCNKKERRASKQLMQMANAHKFINLDNVMNSQFPRVITRNGKVPIIKPDTW